VAPENVSRFRWEWFHRYRATTGGRGPRGSDRERRKGKARKERGKEMKKRRGKGENYT